MKQDKLDNISDIDFKAVYQGYLWPSNQTEPIICDSAKSLEQEVADYYSQKHIQSVPDFSKKNPFIVEGFLKNDLFSISIKYADGRYYIQKFSDLSYNEEELITFHSHRMDNRLLQFYQNWISETDDYCNGYDVLRPAEYIFVGFKTGRR